jgi:hypothetical protein
MTYIPTKLPVRFYGMPDGKVYMVYARFYKQAPDRTDMEFVLALHQEFRYDYSSGKLIPENATIYPVYSEMVDKPNPIFQILQVSRNVKTYSEALELLNALAEMREAEPVLC